MPKIKSSRAAAKRFRRTASGRFKHKQSHLRHILTKKDSKLTTDYSFKIKSKILIPQRTANMSIGDAPRVPKLNSQLRSQPWDISANPTRVNPRVMSMRILMFVFDINL